VAVNKLSSGKPWNPISPKKSCGTQSKIILQDNDKIVTKNVDVAEVFNKFFVNVAQDIGKDYTFNKNDDPSLQKIEDKNFVKNSFEFKSTNETFVSKVIDKFNVKKATGVDKISVKLMKLGKISLLSPITKIINMSIDSGIFPNRLKEAQVTPLLKKNDPFLKSNYYLYLQKNLKKFYLFNCEIFLIIFLTIFYVRLEKDMAVKLLF